MKKTVIIFILLALNLLGCAAQPMASIDTQSPQQIEDFQPRQTLSTEEQKAVYSEAEDDYVRYTGGGISILLEGGFSATTAELGNVVYTNGFLTAVCSATDDYDAQMLASSGYDMAELTEEEYGSIMIDANKLDTDTLFYDSYNNVCLTYTGKDGSGNDYEAYSVIKKDTQTNTFWLLQYIGAPAVMEPYRIYFPEWAAGTTFLNINEGE